MSRALTRCAVLIRSGSFSSTVIPPSPIWTPSSTSSVQPMRRVAGCPERRRIAMTIVATMRIEASAATRRWLYSMSTSARSGGITLP
jgi:hypothetical protein